MKTKEECMTVPIVGGHTAKIDISDYHLVSGDKWYIGSSGYAVTVRRIGHKRKTILMHRLIVSTPPGLVTDHLNGDKLDNRRINLRACTYRENGLNRFVKGYYFNKSKKTWQTQYRGHFYGNYKTEYEARMAIRLAKSGVPYHKKTAPIRRYIPKGITYDTKQAARGWSAYRVRVGVSGKRIGLGNYRTLDEAKEVLNRYYAKESTHAEMQI